ncbi:efflux transporter outer membrane subunit [Inhella proteolytica]|nr:efflux transporter outer membrane subunit [Inhella proteolytica]
MNRTALSLLAIASLSACMNLAPAHQRPALPVAEAVGQPAEAAVQLPNWQGFYADARLQRLIETALRHNRDLRVALANVEQAAALARVSDANRWPAVGLGAAMSRQPKAQGEGISSNYQVGLQLSAYEIDLWGKLKNQSEAAQARYLASTEGARAAQLSLVAAVASAHYALQTDEQLLALARRTLESRLESHRLVKLRFDQGAASSLELQGAISALEATRAALAQAERQRAQDEHALVLLTGQSLGPELPAATPLLDQALAPLAAGVRSEQLLQRPDVRQAEAQLIAAEANIGAARAAFFPSIFLSTSAGTASSQLSELFKQSAWSFSGQLLQPLFDAGRNRANLAASQAARDAAVAQYDKAVQQAFREVADALVARSTLTEQLRAQEAQAAAEAERLRLVELRFANGASSQLELLDAQRASFAAQQAALQVRLASLQAGVGLFRALGGGG